MTSSNSLNFFSMRTAAIVQPKPDPAPLEVVRESYARLARGDLPGLLSLLSTEVVITQSPEVPWGGLYTGHAGARDFLARLNRYVDATPDPIMYVPAGRDVAVAGRLCGQVRVTRKPIDFVVVHLWTVRAGKVVRFSAYADAPSALDALELR